MAMGTFPFQWPMDPAPALPSGLDGSLLPSLLPPPPAPVPDDGAAYYAAADMQASSMPELAPPFPSRDAVAAELAMRRAEEEVAGIRLVHLLMSCAGAVEAGDHALAAAHLADANASLAALALRPGGPPFLRITGIGPPSPPGRDELRDVGLRLADLARSVRVRFSFRGVAANSLDEVHPWMLQIAPGEAVAVNSVLQLHRLLADSADQAPIDAVLDCVASLQPKIFTVVEQEAEHNKPGFLDRFTEALFYYSAVFDSLDAASANGTGNAMAEAYLQREICDIVCNDGSARMERHEPLSQWRDRLGRAGLSAVPLGASALRQARMLLGLFSGEGHSVEEAEGCLTLGWHGRPLFSASAWRAVTVSGDVDGEDNHTSNNSNFSGSSGGGSDSNNSSSSNGKCSRVVGASNVFL
ncbi:unnamed protein product [Triticum turgidum subsp. durum]|uniref:DELLA protein n=1 Tax=Triticum turgidum subsp. durum TaxID=4567 RepID=A0A9R0RKH0_TRITD|nr:unnamed protein product [Triticum turgidum subsp. durum]